MLPRKVLTGDLALQIWLYLFDEKILSESQKPKGRAKKVGIAQALLKVLPPPATQQATQSGRADLGSDQAPASSKRIRLDPSEEAAVLAYIQKLRKEKVTSSSASSWDSYIMPPPPAVTKHAGLSWPCPLLLLRRQQNFTDKPKIVEDLRKQLISIDSWATTSVFHQGVSTSLLQVRVVELRNFLPELAQKGDAVPSSWGATEIITAYKKALSSAADELDKQVVKDDVAAAVDIPVRSSAIVVTRASDPVPAALSSHAADTFRSVTRRDAQPLSSHATIEDCCFLASQYNEHKLNLSGALGISIQRRVPQESLAIISRRMAPVGNKLATASGLFPGSSKEAKREQNAVQSVLSDVFEQGNIVALERIKRGSAVDRVERAKSGALLSKREREESLSRESRALARIAVLSCLVDRGSSALGKLQVGLQVPSLAEHIASMSGMDSVAAVAAAKATLSAGISQHTFIEQEEARKKKAAAAARAVFRNHNNGNNNNGNGGNGGNGGRRGGRKKRKRGRRGRNNRKCNKCGKTGHIAVNCPQSAPSANASS